MNTSSLDYLIHIPKSAGMSLQALVRRRYKKKNELRLIYTQKENDEGFDDHDDLKIVMGHYRFGFHKYNPRPYKYHTFLRNPLDHILSHYYYIQDHPEKFEFLESEELSLMEFAQSPYGNNLQTRFISGIDSIKGKERECLYVAKCNLVKKFETIGLTEEFDRSILLLAKNLNWPIAYYTFENKGKAKVKRKALTQKEKANLESLLKYDIELYAFAKELYRNQLNKNPEIEQKIKTYLLANKAFQKLNPTYIKLKQFLGKA